MKYVTVDPNGLVVGKSSSPVTMEGYTSIYYPLGLDESKKWLWTGRAFQEVNVPTEAMIDRHWQYVRTARSRLLNDSDWTQTNDSPLSNSKKQEWANYRKALRDITKQADPTNLVWPVQPE